MARIKGVMYFTTVEVRIGRATATGIEFGRDTHR